MDRLHARYPFLDAAREAVEAAEVDLAAVVASEGSPVVDRGVERVTTAIEEGRVGPPRRSARVELVSYPVARVVVSLVGDPALTRAYARAEAATALDRLAADEDAADLKSGRDERLTVDRLLAEFDVADAVRETADGYRVGVGPYLRLSGRLDDDGWRLVRRRLGDGEVPVDDDELLALLREATEDRIAEGLPLSVPEVIAGHLDDAVATVRGLLADQDLAEDIDAVKPGLFPPCVDHLLDRLGRDESLPEHSRFAVVSFLSSIGMDPDTAVTLVGAQGDLAEDLRYQAAGIGDEDGAIYPPPSCATMQAYGDCVNKDDLCAEISNPLSYYERRLARDSE